MFVLPNRYASIWCIVEYAFDTCIWAKIMSVLRCFLFMLVIMHRLFCLFFVLMGFLNSFAEGASVLTGYWLTRKHDTNALSSVIYLSVDDNGQIIGRVVAGFYQEGQPLPLRNCAMCSQYTQDGVYGLAKDQAILGSYPVWGFANNGQKSWVNGKVIRIKTGQLFNANMELKDKNTLQLIVRFGFLSQSLIWKRLSDKTYRSYCKGDLTGLTDDSSYRIHCLLDDANRPI